MPARPRAECGVGAGGRASRRQAWEPQTARLEAQRLDALPLALPRPPPLPGLWDERCVRRACAARGPAGSPGEWQRGRSGGDAAEKPEGELGAHGGWGCGRLPFCAGAVFLLHRGWGAGGRRGSFILKIFKRRLDLDLALLASILSFART